MPKSAKPLPPLSDEQKATIDRYWQDPADVLLLRVWPDKVGLTLRHMEWKACKAYLATIGKSATESTTVATEGLTTEQQEFIRANYEDAAGPTELARTLFKDEKLMPGSGEVRAVLAFIRRLDPAYRREDEPVEMMEYQPPKNVINLAGRLNRYGITNDGHAFYEGNKFKPVEQRNLDALLSYMRRPVFKVEAEKFTKRIDREVYEEIFLSNCVDKPDLSPEHVLQYIQLAGLSVQRNQADRTARKLNERFDASLEDAAVKLSKTEVDALKETAAKQGETVKQISALIKTLSGERKTQINERMAGAASMYPLIQAWKRAESRARIIEQANAYRAELKGEVERLSGMDALVCEIWGTSKTEILN